MIRPSTLAFFFLPYLIASSASSDDWLKEADLQQALTRPLSISWQDDPYYDTLRRLSENSRVALFLDRRLDPSRAGIPNSIRDQTLIGTIYLSGVDDEIGGCLIGNCVYVGPAEFVAVLPTAVAQLRKQIRELPRESRRIWERVSPLQVPRLSQPAQVISDLAEAHELQLLQPIEIPLDLMREIDLPSLTVAEQFAILLTGFGKWPEISADGKSIALVDFPLEQSWTIDYPTETPRELTDWIRDLEPQLTVNLKSRAVQVIAPAATHARISRHLATRPTKTSGQTPTDQLVVSLKAEASIGAILNGVADQLGVKLVFAPEITEDLKKRVAVDVQKVAYTVLLDQVFAETNLGYSLDDSQLQVFRK